MRQILLRLLVVAAELPYPLAIPRLPGARHFLVQSGEPRLDAADLFFKRCQGCLALPFLFAAARGCFLVFLWRLGTRELTCLAFSLAFCLALSANAFSSSISL